MQTETRLRRRLLGAQFVLDSPQRTRQNTHHHNLGHRPILSTDDLGDFSVDFTMQGDGIALGHFLGDGTYDVRFASRNLVGRSYLLDGIDLPTLRWWRNYTADNKWDSRAGSALGQINYDNHSLGNYSSRKGLLRTPVSQLIVGYDGSRRAQ